MWDWPFLLYVGTVLLNRTETAFWKMTPRKLDALVKMHIYVNRTQDEEAIPEGKKYIDQIM